ncbi:sugar transferase [Cognatishimia sp. WU-CL00825]|uniref:sugar transferase n=1 Tax=Cognatishimia sp. WU-CL00825 TaxID=3127658 RepID=UPI003107AA2A
MTLSKRIFDLTLVLLMLPFLLPVMIVTAIAVLILQGRPIFYVSERMKTADQGFALWKFRTMTADQSDTGASGGHKAARITPLGQKLRKYRIDELPQLWNIFRGDMTYVGPRPPLRRYVELRPDLYKEVLKCRPGVTGLATIVYNKEETRLLQGSSTGAENDAIYLNRCVPRKAHIDLIYRQHQSVMLDLYIIFATLNKRLRAAPKRPKH